MKGVVLGALEELYRFRWKSKQTIFENTKTKMSHKEKNPVIFDEILVVL